MTTLRKPFLLLTTAAFLALAFALPPATGKTPTSRTRCNENSESIQTNVEGKYQGTVDYPSGNLSGEATLEIGPMQSLGALRFNPFSITSGGTKLSGRIIAITTCRYTTATLFFDTDSPNQQPDPTRVISLQACKGNNQHPFSLNNATVSPTPRAFVFTSTEAEIADNGNWGHCP
jgi:hypothetical protein